MGQSAKAVLGALVIFCAIGAFCGWASPIKAGPIVLWTLRLGLPLVGLGILAVLLRAAMRPDLAPDFLRATFGRPFERDGVCFVVVPFVRGHLCHVAVVFQNQYDRPCDFRVVVQPPAKSFRMTARQFDGVAMDFPCAGGAVGVACAPMGIPDKFQGKAMAMEVAGATNYRDGRGQLLRFRNGLRAGRADSAGLGIAAAAFAVAAAGGGFVTTKPATLTLRLPSGVAEQSPPRDGQTPAVRTIWRPGDPTDGVPDAIRQAMAELTGGYDDPAAAISTDTSGSDIGA